MLALSNFFIRNPDNITLGPADGIASEHRRAAAQAPPTRSASERRYVPAYLRLVSQTVGGAAALLGADV